MAAAMSPIQFRLIVAAIVEPTSPPVVVPRLSADEFAASTVGAVRRVDVARVQQVDKRTNMWLQ
jgi:hypothetical protein